MTPDTALALPRESTNAITPMDLVSMAVSSGADLEKLEKLMELQQRWEANEARKAYERDFAAFKDQTILIVKNIKVSDGPLKGKSYADLFAVVNAVTPALSKNRLSSSWKITKDEPAWIEVTCTIRHELGHSEAVSMGGPPDTGGAKNAIQARASTVTYLQRYTLLAATGMAAGGTDTDGNSPKVSGIPEERQVEQIDWIMAAKTTQELFDIHAAAHVEAQKVKDADAIRGYMKAKEARKAELKKEAGQ